MRSVLVANRGEIACRVIRACTEAGLDSVAVFAEDEAGALHTELATRAVGLTGQGPSAYLDGEAIIAAARASGADAVHPGFGFLSERADFARAVMEAGLVWIGPSPEAIERMGDKMTARITMRDAGVPVIPGCELETPTTGEEERDFQSVLASVRLAAENVGYPLLLKASAGGGGKGMREVHSEAQLEDALRSARREAMTAFGDGRVYIERLLRKARHVEVQVLADGHGRTVHLGERECSIQRRHQKVFEESPSPAMNADLRARMGAAAVAAATAVDYVGAGTVEFLLEEDGTFHFLEMNTRIQVEHPITEAVTGVDLVAEQLRIASGEAMQVGDLHLQGHAIEVRIYAEDPSNAFLPSIGPLAVFRPPTGPGVRFDTGVREGDVVSPSYDPMLAKLVVHAPSRGQALARMRRALDDFVVLGTTTNVGFLRDLLDLSEVVNGTTYTTLIDEVFPAGWTPPVPSTAALAVAACAASMPTKSTSSNSAPSSPFISVARRLP